MLSNELMEAIRRNISNADKNSSVTVYRFAYALNKYLGDKAWSYTEHQYIGRHAERFAYREAENMSFFIMDISIDDSNQYDVKMSLHLPSGPVRERVLRGQSVVDISDERKMLGWIKRFA